MTPHHQCQCVDCERRIRTLISHMGASLVLVAFGAFVVGASWF